MSTDQVFELTAVVTNAGVADIDVSTPAQVSLTLPAGFTIDSGPAPTIAFTIDTPIIWNVRAPVTSVSAQALVLDISTKPDQLNLPAGNESAASQPSDTVQVDVLDSGCLRSHRTQRHHTRRCDGQHGE